MLGLNQFLSLDDKSSILATGAGNDRLLFYYANLCKEIWATDLYDEADGEGTAQMLTKPAQFAPFPYAEDRLHVERMSPVDLRFENNSFHAAFCLSSIQHFGSRADQRSAVREMARVLKPGGIACIVTEIILNDAKHPEYFRPEEIDNIFLKHSNLKLVGGDIDLQVQKSLFDYPCDLREPKHANKSPHIVLTDGTVIWTSLSLFLQKSEG
ncbi:class I SAM-dependent methyltransferase [Rhizobium sp. SL86]|uniref:class I SAM-dependent methyltransferase n=1 Tax=Rhizobium sp. SL86 TaxID=2995148 RepID=UPI0022725A22|nr:class I SAM-dependent methyltransferase [Rhizobium sp. SL86]MCY1669397.1 class I SAM-dependent methyltransferase [Rhizobium sp. SL86]